MIDHRARPPCALNDILTYRRVKALAESVIGRYKTEIVRKDGPRRSVDDMEFATLGWLASFNDQRLLGPIGDIPSLGIRTII